MNAQENNNGTIKALEPVPAKPLKAWKLFLAGAVAFVLLIVIAITVLNKIRTASFEDDPYVKANNYYKLAFDDYQNGDYKASAGKFEQALQQQKLPEGEQVKGKPDVIPNLVTHNSAGLLAILSAKNGDCKGYWKYRTLAERIAAEDWYYVMMGERQEQKNDAKKQSTISEAAYRMQEAERLCSTDGPPVPKFDRGGKGVSK